jgi:hypothetical protein
MGVVWLLPASVPTIAVVLKVTGALQVRRHSRRHISARLAVRGRGIYFSRTPDGDWWKLRLRRRRCVTAGNGQDPPPDIAVREPRHPKRPSSGAGVRLDLP